MRFVRRFIISMGFSEKVMNAGKSINALLVIGFLGIVWLIIYGNLSQNVGFTTDSAGYNNTENVIANLTSGVNTFFTFAPTWFTILAIVLLIIILVGLLKLVMSIAANQKGGGFAE